MKVLFLHISDIHIKNSNDSIIKKIDKFFDSFKNRLDEVDQFVIVSSGDIAFSGEKTQYMIAQEIINTIKAKTSEYSKHSPEFIVVPGNHDCYFNEEKQGMRKLVIQDFSDNGFEVIDPYKIEVCCEPQKEFENFLSHNSGHLIDKTNHPLLKHYKLNFGKVSIKILGYNSAWFSQLNEKPGYMRFPIDFFKNDWEIGNDDLIISLIHHPLNWQTPDDARIFKKHLEGTSDVILSGHEHADNKGQYSNLEGNNTIYIESPVLQENDDPRKSGYNLIYFDLSKQLFKMEVMLWNAGVYQLKDSIDWKPLKRGQDEKKRKININDSFLNLITDPGASFDHEAIGDDISLADLFIYPNISASNSRGLRSKSNVVFSSKIIFDEFLNNSKRLLILGEEVSGKTTVCISFFLNITKKGKFLFY